MGRRAYRVREGILDALGRGVLDGLWDDGRVAGLGVGTALAVLVGAAEVAHVGCVWVMDLLVEYIRNGCLN